MRLACNTGGTFTDLVAKRSGAASTHISELAPNHARMHSTTSQASDRCPGEDPFGTAIDRAATQALRAGRATGENRR